MNQRHVNPRLLQAVRTICGRRTSLSAPAVALLGFSMVSVALAGPTGGVVVSGDATISTPGAGRTVIEQSSQLVQLNWNTFDVAANESVQFQQPSSSAVALNRILDQNPSQIFGRLDSNGQVILVNPNGILFGNSAQLNVGSLVASSLDVIGFDAATGRYTFGTSRADVGAVVNDGTITAARGGSVTLLGGRVANNGSILADFGTVNLAAGRAATLDLAGDGLLRLEVDGELLSNNDGADSAVQNNGVIEASGGQVLLTAQAVDDVFANLVNNTGVVRANRIDNSGGTIRLMGAGGTVRSSGVLDASAGDAVSSGGTVEMLGEQVGLFGAARVNVSGATSGGTALIGGDYQGNNPDVLNAARTYVSAEASIRADAGVVGDGGRVIVWADEITRFNGSISARGGSVSGNGGFAEVSGKGTLVFRGSANLSAINGFAGQLLLDPRNIIVATGGVGDLDGAAGDDGDPNTYAFAEDAGDDITIAPTTITDILDTGTTVTLQAHNDITVTDAIDGSTSTTPGGGLIFQAGDDIVINADVRTNGGAIQFTAGANAATPTGADGDDAPTGELRVASSATLSAGAAAVTLNSDSNMQLLGTVSGNAITAVSGGSLTVGTLNAGTGAVNLTASGALLDDGNNSTRITGGALTLGATSIGTTGTTGQIDTNVTSLTATAGAGSVYIGELNGLTLTNVSASTGNDVVVTSTTGDIVVNTVSGPDEVWLNAAAGAIVDDNNNATRIAAGSLTLLAGTSIGATGTTGQIDTNVASLTAITGSGGVYIGELNGLTLTNVSASGAGNDVVVTSTTGDIVVNQVSAANAVTLTATAGAIVDDNNDGTRIAATALTLSAGTAIGAAGASGQIDTNVTSLTATANAGGVYIGELNGLTLTNVSAAGAGNDVVVTSTAGDIVVNTVSAPDAVTLTATNGAITDDNNDATFIAGASVSLSAATNIGTVTDFTAANDANVGSSLDVQTNGALTATVASTIGQINLNLSGAPTLATGAITLGSGSNRAGAVVLQSAGNLNAAGFAPGAINIGSNSTTSVGLRSGALLTLPAGGGFTDQPAGRLLVRGASDVIDNDGTPREFTFAATSLDFRSGAAGGATTLNTSVDQLSASVGNNQNLIVNETNGVTVGSLSAGNGNITLTAGGAVADDGDDSTRIVSSVATLSGTSLGTASSALDTQVTTLNASATNGGVYINEADALALTVSATGGAADVRTASGALTVASAIGNGVTLIAGGAGNAITLNGAVNAGVGDVTLTAGTTTNRGAIVAGVGSQITGGSLTATGSAIGTNAARLNTTVAALNATSSNGGIFISESDALNLTAAATGGAVDVATTNGALTVAQATGTGVTLAAGGAGNGITLNGAVNAGTGDVTLTAGTLASRGAIVAGSGNQVTGGSFTATGSAIGSSAGRLNTTVTSLNATSTNGGLFITETNALTLTASATNGTADVRTTNGALTVTSATGEGVTLAAGGAGNGLTLNDAVSGGAGNVSLTAGGGIALNNAVTTSTGDVTLVAGGAITAGAGTHITGGSLTVSGSMVGTSAARLNTTVSSLNATSTNGGIFITETDALTLAANATGGAVNVETTNGALTVTQATGNAVTLTAGGAGNDITVNGAVNAGTGDVTLTAVGTITAGAGARISGGSLTASGSMIGTSAARLNTSVASLNATSTSGGIFITESDALSVTANAAGGAVDVATTNGALTVTQATGTAVSLAAGGAGNALTLNGAANASTGDVTLTAGGGITLNNAVTASTGNVTLAAGGAIIAGTGSQITGGSLTASGAAIGSSAARLNTTVASLNATSTNGGIFITEADALNLTASATGGATDVQTSNGSLTTAAVSGDGVMLTAGGAGNGITLNGALNARAGDVTLTTGTTASRGTIAGTAGHSLSGRALTATATSIGASNARLNTSIDTLNAVASTGDVYISEQNGLTLANVTAARDINVTSLAGNIVVNTVTATNNVTLAASAGAITDDGDDSTRISANALTLNARSIGAASTISGTTLNSTARLDTDVTTLNATATAGGVFIDEANGLQNVIVQAAGGAAGDIELLTQAGDLVLQQVNASDTLLLAAGRNILSAAGAGPVTARVAELRAGTTDPTGGQIGTLADLLELQLSAGNSLRLFVPQTIDPNDPNRAPATLPSAGVTTTLNLFSASTLAAKAGFNQFQGLGETQFTSPAEALVKNLQSQTGTVQAGLEIDWGAFNADVSLFGTLEPAVCLPSDQRDEEDSSPEC